MLRITALTIFLALTNTVLSECTDVEGAVPTLCYDYSDMKFDLDPDACKPSVIFRKFKAIFNAKAETGERCKGGVKRDAMALTGTVTIDGSMLVFHDLCVDALADAASQLKTTGWELGDSDIDLGEFFDGSGFLNEETGNFVQKTDEFMKRGGYDRFLTIDEDPRKNEHYHTSEESYQAGAAVKNLYQEHSKSKYFSAPVGNFEHCKSNTVMCCWGRDRQYFDGNGGCQFADCAHEDPGDNTDLCWTEENGEVFPYPGDTTEQDLHCHGISWGDDSDSGYDINSSAKWNSLFYVSMYDHMYKRGYVESITNDSKIAGDHAMCNCIEEMPPVARADCNEVVGITNYQVSFDSESKHIKIDPTPDTFELSFQACEGYKFVEDFSPEDYALDNDSNELRSEDNDLAAFVFRQYLEGKIDESHVAIVEETLAGYRKPEVKNSDQKREQACQAAFEKKFPGIKYEEKELTATNGIDV